MSVAFSTHWESCRNANPRFIHRGVCFPEPPWNPLEPSLKTAPNHPRAYLGEGAIAFSCPPDKHKAKELRESAQSFLPSEIYEAPGPYQIKPKPATPTRGNPCFGAAFWRNNRESHGWLVLFGGGMPLLHGLKRKRKTKASCGGRQPQKRRTNRVKNSAEMGFRCVRLVLWCLECTSWPELGRLKNTFPAAHSVYRIPF